MQIFDVGRPVKDRRAERHRRGRLGAGGQTSCHKNSITNPNRHGQVSAGGNRGVSKVNT
jgi:hypothetical protein